MEFTILQPFFYDCLLDRKDDVIAKHSENGMVFTTVDDGCRISFAIDTIIRYSHKISNTLCLKALRYNFTMHMDGCSPMLLDIHNYNL